MRRRQRARIDEILSKLHRDALVVDVLRVLARDDRRQWTLDHVAEALALKGPRERTNAAAVLHHVARIGIVNSQREPGCPTEYMLNTLGVQILGEIRPRQMSLSG
jgi:hypothetical protein